MSGDGTMTAATRKLPRTANFQRFMGTLPSGEIRRYYRFGSFYAFLFSTKHSVTLKQVESWLASTSSSPHVASKKTRLKMMLMRG